jgi:threonine/homoserine/homoserine lactone efflux protein
MYSQLFPLILFAIAASFSPGPNNIVTSYTSFNFGFKKTIPTMLGVVIGWMLLVIFLQMSSGIIFKKFKEIQITIKILGSVYLLYMAYKISFSDNITKKTTLKPVTFLSTFFFQFINPKAIIYALLAISMFVDVQNNYLRDSIALTIIFFFGAVGSQLTWCFIGKYLRKFATSKKLIKSFNYSMSFLLIVCVILFYV